MLIILFIFFFNFLVLLLNSFNLNSQELITHACMNIITFRLILAYLYFFSISFSLYYLIIRLIFKIKEDCFK